MTSRQTKFVHEFLIDLNATQAAIRAGYSPKTARSIACENLTKPDIVSAIRERGTRQLERADLSVARTLEELSRIAFADIRVLFNDHDELRPLHELTAEQAAPVASYRRTTRRGRVGHSIRLWDRLRALELLAKRFGLLGERGAVVHDDAFVEQVNAVRHRLAATRASLGRGRPRGFTPEKGAAAKGSGSEM